MKRLAALLQTTALALAVAACCSAASTAASWDGTYNDLTIQTQQFNPRQMSLMGLPVISGFAAPAMQIWLKSTDPSVTGFRVTATILDDSGWSYTLSVLANAQTNGAMTMAPFWSVRADQIVSLSITRLRDGETIHLR